MTGPMNFASAVTGLPSGKTPKKTHRGRKPSGKPGASHLAALQQAHGAGDFKAAKTHALNYAKAAHSATMAVDEPDVSGIPDDAQPIQMKAALGASPLPVAPAPDGRARLAKLAMNRKK